MTKLRRHLSFANVVSCLALFVALGGASYAAVNLPKKSVGSRELKPKAVRTGQLAPEAAKAGKVAKNAIVTNRLRDDAVTGAKVDEATLGTVPSAALASVAGSAGHAAAADNATNAVNAARRIDFQGPATDPSPKKVVPGAHLLLAIGALTIRTSCAPAGIGEARVIVSLETAEPARYHSELITFTNPGYEPRAGGGSFTAGEARWLVDEEGGNVFSNGSFVYRTDSETIAVNLHASAGTFTAEGCNVEGTAVRAVV